MKYFSQRESIVEGIFSFFFLYLLSPLKKRKYHRLSLRIVYSLWRLLSTLIKIWRGFSYPCEILVFWKNKFENVESLSCIEISFLISFTYTQSPFQNNFTHINPSKIPTINTTLQTLQKFQWKGLMLSQSSNFRPHSRNKQILPSWKGTTGASETLS